MAALVRAGPVALATQLMDGNRLLDNREIVRMKTKEMNYDY